MKQFTAPKTPPDPPSGETWLSVGRPVFIVVVVVALACVAAYYRNQRWRAFTAEHECKVVGKMTGDMTPTLGFDTRGSPTVGVALESDKVGWKCNDGITYWR